MQWSDVIRGLEESLCDGCPLDLFFDIDGTIIEGTRYLDQALVKRLSLLEMHCGISIITGRSLIESIGIIKDIPINRPAVFLDGGLIYDLIRGKIIFDQPIATIEIINVVNRLKQYAFVFYEYCNTLIVSSSLEASIFAAAYDYPRKKIVISDAIPAQVHRIYVRWFDADTIHERETILRLLIGQNLYIGTKPPMWCFVNRYSEKLSGFCLMESKDIVHKERTVYFGNDQNDIELLGYIRWGITVFDSQQAAKSRACCTLSIPGVNGMCSALDDLFGLFNSHQHR